MRILFVCTGNTCRSPMAEALALKVASEVGLDDVEALSAGVAAFPGVPASHQAVEAMQERGIDLSGHRTKTLTKELIDRADLILCMTNGHRQAVLRLSPEAKDKLHLLKGFAGEASGDVADPFGQSVEVYRLVADEIEDGIRQALKKMKGNGPEASIH